MARNVLGLGQDFSLGLWLWFRKCVGGSVKMLVRVSLSGLNND